MAPLTDGQLHALRNLARKGGGDEVPFINIADARALTELGYATRGREGWDITAEGQALLARMAGPPSGSGGGGPQDR
ncbi:hypothetical protein [Phenylobacterium sp.]|uniref:hypothetical protein n=1 Tax=Phenylobacterium sp. TaxID=1871053 RepID=UPI002DF64FF9|nr:hypothetical protein [Phenylobacterium sp.]